MEKTKFGVSVGLLSMLCYFTGYANFTACILLLIVALVWSDSLELKKNACQAAVLSVFFSLASIALNWISGKYVDLINTVSGWINKLIDFYEVQNFLVEANLFSFLSGLVGLVELIVMFIFVFKSLKGKSVKIPVVTNIVKKHFGEEVESKKDAKADKAE